MSEALAEGADDADGTDDDDRVVDGRGRLSRSGLSGWENGYRTPGDREVDRLDGLYGQQQRLRDVVLAIRRTHAVPADVEWGAHPDGGPVWGWFRAASTTTAQVTWGPWQLSVAVPGGAFGLAVTSPISIPNPPLLVRFAEPGRFDVVPGKPPEWLETPVVDGLTLLEPDQAPNQTLWWLARSIAKIAPGAIESAVGMRSGWRQQLLRHVAPHPPPVPPVVVPASEVDTGVVVDAALAQRARAAAGWSVRVAAIRAAELAPTVRVTPTRVDRLEKGARSDPILAAALDGALELDGRLVRAPVAAGRDHVDVDFPGFWRGPVWVVLSDPRSNASAATLDWALHRKPLAPEGPCVVTCRKSSVDQKPLSVDAPGWAITAGIGRHPDGFDVNPSWMMEPAVWNAYRDRVLDPLVAALNERRRSRSAE